MEWVNYARAAGSSRARAGAEYLGGKAPGLFTFGSRGAPGRAALSGCAAALYRLVNIGDAKSLATHPASTTHRQLNPEELARAGCGRDGAAVHRDRAYRRPDCRPGPGAGGVRQRRAGLGAYFESLKAWFMASVT
ncbi:cys/Met metabolism PLP-dependent enzyme family protein [Bordetella holmesii 35009]|nr:cys/Met metabolism PLP-dependent enzyme family protein [Bordetella holmesii 35009]